MTFGDELKRERELREISLREVSNATKINLRFLEALEQNEFANLPGGLFNRGFVRAYAEYIGVDPEAMVNAYLLEEQAQGGSAPRGPLLRRTRTDNEIQEDEAPARSGVPAWAIWVIVAVALLGGIGYFIVRALRADPAEPVANPASARTTITSTMDGGAT